MGPMIEQCTNTLLPCETSKSNTQLLTQKVTLVTQGEGNTNDEVKKQKVVNIFYKHTDSSARDIGNPSFNIPFFALRASARQLRKVDASKNSVKKGDSAKTFRVIRCIPET